MSPVFVAFGCGILVGVAGTWSAAKARILDLQHRQDVERAEWHQLEHMRRESDRINYGVGQATRIERPQLVAFLMRTDRGA